LQPQYPAIDLLLTDALPPIPHTLVPTLALQTLRHPPKHALFIPLDQLVPFSTCPPERWDRRQREVRDYFEDEFGLGDLQV
jgi:hypothetical protein